ncbi:PASTA domain-containing protein [Pseudonocardia sp. MH-G8]|uniref:PASTA domain-containing protein n=1 Tax=Pseudonocardia sp. MH-G8 TaxID=1854588 RepID=UPI0013042E8B|nr:PASTA domain-containing protein [Pseudonocardia sp. MH-G8]
MVLFAALVGIGLGSGPTTTSATGSRAATTPARTPAANPATPQLAVPDVQGMTGEDAVATLGAAGFSNVIVEQNGAPVSAPVISQNPLAGHLQDTDDPIRLLAEPPPPVPHREIAARDWQLIAKSPDGHIGERIVVHGHVTQFDTATGLDAFRAGVDAVRHSRTYEYDTNTILRGTAAQLANVVNGDMFRAHVTVRGSYSYETTMGGTLTVPVLGIDAIEVTG